MFSDSMACFIGGLLAAVVMGMLGSAICFAVFCRRKKRDLLRMQYISEQQIKRKRNGDAD